MSVALGRYRSGVRRIARDRTHGASYLALELLRLVEEVSWSAQESPDPPTVRQLTDFTREIERAQPALGSFRQWSAELREQVRDRTSILATREWGQWARRTRDGLGTEPAGLRRTVRRWVPAHGRLVTISRSSAVRDTLTALPGHLRPAEVVVLHSLPGGEGRAMARDLHRAGLRARVVDDRAALGAVSTANLVLLGADAVYPDGALVHKVGTRSLVNAARQARVPVAVVAGRSKFVRAYRTPPRELPRLFDSTPGTWITWFWTEVGRWRPRPRIRR